MGNISKCKYCGADIEWYQQGRPPRNPTTKETHNCRSTNNNTEASSPPQPKTSGPDLSLTPAQAKERAQFDVILDWHILIEHELVAVKHDLELSIMYNRVTMRALYFLCEEMEKKGAVGSIDAYKKKSIFIDPMEKMEEKLKARDAERNQNSNPEN